MAGLKTIYDRDGVPIADFKASATRSSSLSGIGEAIFYIHTSSVKARRELLKFGNYVVIQHDKLPDWVGVIDTPRPWRHGYVEVHAFEPAFILQYRLASNNSEVVGTPAAQFSRLLEQANTQEDTLIRSGVLTSAGATTSMKTTSTIFNHMKDLRENNKLEWAFSPIIDGAGRLTIVVDLIERVGIDTDLELSQGHNIMYGETPLEESGELINAVEAYNDVSDGTPLTTLYRDEPSIADIGLRLARATFSGVTDLTSLKKAAKEFVDGKKIATFSTPITLVNVGQTFNQVRNGNTAAYRYTDVGFTEDGLGASRIIRMDGWRYDETNDTCELMNGTPDA